MSYYGQHQPPVGVPPQQGYPGKVAAAETGAVYDNSSRTSTAKKRAVYDKSGMFAHESGMTAGEAFPLPEQVRKLKDQLKGSVYNSSGMADSSMSLKDQLKGTVYNSSAMADSGMSLKDQTKVSVYNCSGMSLKDQSGIYPGKATAAERPETGAVYDNSGMFARESGMTAGEVFTDKAVAAVGREKVAGAFTERVRPSLPFVGLAAASLAVTGLSASQATPAVGFALFALLLGGLSLVTSSVCSACKDSAYNSSSMASAVDYGAVYGDSGMFPAAKKGSVYDNSGMPPPADKDSYYNMFAHEPDVTVGEALPFTVTEQVFADKAVAAVGRDKVAGAFTERVHRFLPVVGTATASLAVTGLAAGTATPAVGFALLTLLLAGLSLVTIGVSQLG